MRLMWPFLLGADFFLEEDYKLEQIIECSCKIEQRVALHFWVFELK